MIAGIFLVVEENKENRTLLASWYAATISFVLGTLLLLMDFLNNQTEIFFYSLAMVTIFATLFAISLVIPRIVKKIK